MNKPDDNNSSHFIASLSALVVVAVASWLQWEKMLSLPNNNWQNIQNNVVVSDNAHLFFAGTSILYTSLLINMAFFAGGRKYKLVAIFFVLFLIIAIAITAIQLYITDFQYILHF